MLIEFSVTNYRSILERLEELDINPKIASQRAALISDKIRMLPSPLSICAY